MPYGSAYANAIIQKNYRGEDHDLGGTASMFRPPLCTWLENWMLTWDRKKERTRKKRTP